MLSKFQGFAQTFWKLSEYPQSQPRNRWRSQTSQAQFHPLLGRIWYLCHPDIWISHGKPNRRGVGAPLFTCGFPRMNNLDGQLGVPYDSENPQIWLDCFVSQSIIPTLFAYLLYHCAANMYVCIMYVCMFMYVYVCLCMFMYVYVCLCMFMYVYVCLCMFMYVYVCLCMFMFMFMFMYVCMYTYMYVYIYVCMYVM